MRCLRITLFCLVSCILHAQDYPRQDIDPSRLTDDLFSIQDQDLNYEELYENMVQILSNPINLNKASAEQLRFLNILSEAQIQNLLLHRSDNGNLISVYELQTIDGFDLQTFYRLMPFVTVPAPTTLLDASLGKRILTSGHSYFISGYGTTVERRKGFTDSATPQNKFKGSDTKFYLRFRSSKPGDFSIGFAAEKDQGEPLQWSPGNHHYGLDYLSFHAQLQNKGRIKNLILGDYQNQFAQGLTFGGVFGLGKGGEPISTVRRSNIGSVPYTSMNEAGYLRGITTTVQLSPSLSITALFSNTRRDGNAETDTTGNSSISAFQTTGYHRNENELKGRKSIAETSYGSIINYKHKNVEGGLIYNHIQFSSPIKKSPTVYNQFAFAGSHNATIGAFLNYSINNVTFFNEVSKNSNGGNGIIAGLLGSLSPQVDMAMLYRRYDRNFHTFYSNAFSENTNPQNETGFYWGWKYAITRRITAAGYIDFFKFPWLRFRSYTPSMGHEWLTRVTYQPAKGISLYIQIREEHKVRNTGISPTLFSTATGIKRNYWFTCEYTISPKIKMKTRAQFSSYEINHTTTNGMTLMQDVRIDLGKLKITGRYASFDTDDYDNRQYVYEQDVWLAYSLPAYYGVGVRQFILAEYTLNKALCVWLRYGRTRYTDQHVIGSGVDAIAGNTRNDLKFQLQIKL